MQTSKLHGQCQEIAQCFEGDDAKEGIAAFLEKRKPNWK